MHSDYNHSTGEFSAPIKITPKPFIVLSGLHPYYLPKMRKAIDLKIYLGPDENLRKYWKIKRDMESRHYTLEKVLDSLKKRAEDSNKYILPQKNFADLVIEFYPQEDFDYKEINVVPKLNLKITLNSNVNIEELVAFLAQHSVKHEWDYYDDLSNQYVNGILKDSSFQKNIVSKYSVLHADFSQKAFEKSNADENATEAEKELANTYTNIIQNYILKQSFQYI